jgi:hypothetical protein
MVVRKLHVCVACRPDDDKDTGYFIDRAGAATMEIDTGDMAL